MSKYLLSMGLLAAALTGLAGATPTHVSTPLMQTVVADDGIGFASGPFATYNQAAAEKLRLQAVGWKVEGPRQEDDGWWVYYSVN